MRKVLKRIGVSSAILLPLVASAQTVNDAVEDALAAGATQATAFLIAAIAIPVAFLVFKLGKRALSRA
jgi:hypothetical protein